MQALIFKHMGCKNNKAFKIGGNKNLKGTRYASFINKKGHPLQDKRMMVYCLSLGDLPRWIKRNVQRTIWERGVGGWGGGFREVATAGTDS
jgi:hypothetical protein